MSLVLTLCTILELTSYTPKSGSSAVEVTGATKNCAWSALTLIAVLTARGCHLGNVAATVLRALHSNRNLILILLLDKIKIK